MSVPKLDLAPKLKRPLSLWNPLDYLRLLYWVFYFPQALGWYVDNFCGGGNLNQQLTWQEKLEFLRKYPLNLRLFVQGLILAAITPFILNQLLKLMGIKINWFGVVVGIATGVMFNITVSMAFGIAFGVIVTLVEGVAVGMATEVALGVVVGMLAAALFGVAVGLTTEVKEGVAVSASVKFVESMAIATVFGVVFGIATGIEFGMEFSVAVGVAFGMVFGVAGSLATIRPDNWLISTIINLFLNQNKSFVFPRVTPLPLPKLSVRLRNLLLKDWELGLDNINQMLQYSLQFISVILAVNQSLNKTANEEVIYRITQLSKNPYDWKLICFISLSLGYALELELINNFLFFPWFFFIPINWKKKVKDKFISNIRFDTPSRAVAAGFWYLHEKKPSLATKVFIVVRSLPYGEEVFTLAHTLAIFQKAKATNDIANITISDLPKENLLRPTSWHVINSLKRVIEDIKLIQHSASRNTKSLAYSRAIGELTEVIDNKNNILEAERELIIDIAQTWKRSLEKIGKDIGNVTITQPVRNPYVIGNPVTGSLFVGREDILRQLEELWITGNQLQSVVLYGHRRMGKTSILKNVANATGAEIKIIYVNLQELGAVDQGVAEVLMAISDEIANSLSIESPDDNDFLQLPQRTFKRYLKQVVATMAYQGLIIALDEFETIEELIQRQQIDRTFMGFLRGLVQMQPDKIAFAFAGLHTLEEMTADYFEPFFASVIPIRVSFLNSGATKTILANPVAIEEIEEQNSENNEFLLDYTGEALDLIYSLTAGQPYLVQLIGFQLVRNYNDQVFEQGKAQDNTLTVKDIETVINPKFFQQGRYYFEGVWGQAAQDAPGQQEIITALAPHPQGLTRDKLAAETRLDGKIIEKAIAILLRHDVIEEKNDHYRIIVELFRQWVIMTTVKC